MRVELECTHPIVRISEITQKKGYSFETTEKIFGCLRKFPPKSQEKMQKAKNIEEIIQDSETEEKAFEKIEKMVAEEG